MNTHTELSLHPAIQEILNHVPGSVLSVVIVAWCLAVLFIPFFLWGIYSQAHKQTRLLREMLAAIQKMK